MKTKRCTMCGAVRPTSDYHRMAASKDGLQPRCKTCRRKVWLDYYDRNRRWLSLPTKERKAARVVETAVVR